jgi:hypothetical protein
MPQLAHAACQPPADLPEGLSLGELAEQHRDELIPARESFRAAFGLMLLDGCLELGAKVDPPVLSASCGFVCDYRMPETGGSSEPILDRRESVPFFWNRPPCRKTRLDSSLLVLFGVVGACVCPYP